METHHDSQQETAKLSHSTPQPLRQSRDRAATVLAARFLAAVGFVLALAFPSQILANAAYDADLGSPVCGERGNVCDSGNLLESSAHMNPPELNPPNTLDGCLDGDDLYYYQDDESIERIVVRSQSGAVISRNKNLEIEITFYAYGDGSGDVLDIFYSDEGTNPAAIEKEHLARYVPQWGGLQTYTLLTTVPDTGSSLHRVRARLGSAAHVSRCSGNGFYDVDELAFRVDVPTRDDDDDKIPDEDEYTFCEKDASASCAPLSYQLRLATLLTFNEELTENEFRNHQSEYEATVQTYGSFTEEQYCSAIAVPNMVALAETRGLHPPSISSIRSHACRWQPNYTSNRSLTEEDIDHCRLFSNESEANRPLIAQAEKALGVDYSENSYPGVCRAFNFFVEVQEALDPLFNSDYDQQFLTLLNTALIAEVFDEDLSDSLKVLLEALFPELMCKLEADDVYSTLYDQMTLLAESYFNPVESPGLKEALATEHWSDERKAVIQDDLGIAFTGGYQALLENHQKLEEASTICEMEAAAKSAMLAKTLSKRAASGAGGAAYPIPLRLGKLLIRNPVVAFAAGLGVSTFNQSSYYTCMAPVMKTAAFGDPEVRQQFIEELEAIESQIEEEVEEVNSTLDDGESLLGEMAAPSQSGILDSFSAPIDFLFGAQLNPGYLDFEGEALLPTVTTYPALHCEANPPYSDLLERSDQSKAALKNDCVSYQFNGSEFELVQTHCSNEMHILCDIEDFDENGGTIVDHFVTTSEYPLAEADSACIAEQELIFSGSSVRTAFAAADTESTNGALQDTEALLEDQDYGTGLILCGGTLENPPAPEVEGHDYETCDGSSSAVATAAAGAVSDEADVEERPTKRRKASGKRRSTANAIKDLGNQILTELQNHLGANILNHYTLPVGQGSCHIMQCIQVPASLTDFEENVIIDNMVYDCGSDGYIGNSGTETQNGNTIPEFVTWIADNLVSAGNQILAKTLLNLVDNSTTHHAIASHGHTDHNTLLGKIWQPGGESVPRHWTLGGRARDFRQEPLAAMMQRLNNGLDVVVNGLTVPGGTSMTDLKDQLEADSLFQADPNADLLNGAFDACDASMRLLTVNAGISEDGTATSNHAQANTASTVVTLEVVREESEQQEVFLAVLPGDGTRATWNSAIENAAGTPVHQENSSSLGIMDFAIRYLASAHHGSWAGGSNDSVVNNYIEPTHVVFSHALSFEHVHNKSWHAYWDSVVANDSPQAPTLMIKDSYYPNDVHYPDHDNQAAGNQPIGDLTWEGDLPRLAI